VVTSLSFSPFSPLPSLPPLPPPKPDPPPGKAPEEAVKKDKEEELQLQEHTRSGWASRKGAREMEAAGGGERGSGGGGVEGEGG